MPFLVKFGSILESQENFIVNLTDCVSSDNSNNDIFIKYPHSDCYTNRTNKDYPGTIEIKGNGTTERYIINLMGQYYPGISRFENDSIEKRLEFFRNGVEKIFKIDSLKSVAFKYDLGGENWKDYKNIIKEFSRKYPNITIVIYKNSPQTTIKTNSQTAENKNIIETDSKISGDSDTGALTINGCVGIGKNLVFGITSSISNPQIAKNEKTSISEDEKFVKLSSLLTEKSWESALSEFAELEKLEKFLDVQWNTGFNVFPPKNLVFHALNLCPLNNAKVVILGQDPYHGKDQAMGLAFSVFLGVPVPPSLKNIYQEIHNSGADIYEPLGKANERQGGDLSHWATQGVILLNTALTVMQGKPNSHSSQWASFTDHLVEWISKNSSKQLIFVLWGNFAKSKKRLIDTKKHIVLEASHPSPLAISKGNFFGCNHFVKINEILKKNGEKIIYW